ncbi:MAG: hypothetical protein JXL20_04945 [Deltaproteobacteria bacterium]|nr:hypothetical protein [Deltaproteobacteria bacterium]
MLAQTKILIDSNVYFRLAHAYILDIPIVTDDTAMLELAQDFDIRTLKTLELLKLMLDCRHIDMAMVKQITVYWNYEDDRPRSFSTDYRKHNLPYNGATRLNR